MIGLLCVYIFLPATVYAETYCLGGTDMSISVDDTTWYVFTRDNIKNNSELEALGISYEYMYDSLHHNEAYMDALLLYADGEFVELFVRKRALDAGVANLSNYANSEVLELAKELAEKQGAGTYSVYENQYKFAKLEYIDANCGYYICEYITVVNKDNYTLTFQATSPFADDEYVEIARIVDSIAFDVDASMKEEKTTAVFDGVLAKTIGGAVIGGVVGFIIAIINKKKKKGNGTDNVMMTKGPDLD